MKATNRGSRERSARRRTGRKLNEFRREGGGSGRRDWGGLTNGTDGGAKETAGPETRDDGSHDWRRRNFYSFYYSSFID